MVDEPFLGEAIFGTINGLTVSGNGQLETLSRSLGLVEFRSLVREAPKGVEIGFKRSIVTHEGIKLDLLGVFVSAKDHVGRDGLMGGAVAIKHADFTSCQEAFARSMSLLDGVLKNSWEWGVEEIEKNLPRRTWGELKGKDLREADENSDVIILKESPAIRLEAVELFSLGTSQVGSVQHYADSLIVVYATPEVTADPVDFTLLEYCRAEQAKVLMKLHQKVDEHRVALEQSTAERAELDRYCKNLESRIEAFEKERSLHARTDDLPVSDGSAFGRSQVGRWSEAPARITSGLRQVTQQPAYRSKHRSTHYGERRHGRIPHRMSDNEDDRQDLRVSVFFKRLMNRQGKIRGYRKRGFFQRLFNNRVAKILLFVAIFSLATYGVFRLIEWTVTKIVFAP